MKKRSVSQVPSRRTAASSNTEIKRSRLTALQLRLDAFHADPVQARLALGADHAQAMPEALKKLAIRGYHTEVQSYLKLVAAAGQNNNRARAKKIFLKGHSLRARCDYLEQGEAALFSSLPLLFDVDTPFFLKEPWIQEIVAQWRQQGEVEKIESMFAGARKGNRGRSFQLVQENRQRDQKIVAAVAQLLQAGHGYNKAMKRTAQTLDTLGIRDRLSSVAIRKIYEAWTKPGRTPLTRVGFSCHPQFSWVFCMCGCSGPSCPRRRASRRVVPYRAGFLDSRFRGNDDAALLSVKNLPLKERTPSFARFFARL